MSDNIYLYAYTRTRDGMIYSGTIQAPSEDYVTRMLHELLPDHLGHLCGKILAIVISGEQMKTVSELVREQIMAEGPNDMPSPLRYAESEIQNMTQLELLDLISNAIEQRLRNIENNMGSLKALSGAFGVPCQTEIITND